MKMNEINRTAETKAALFSIAYMLAAYSAFIINNIYSWQIPEISPCTAFVLHLTVPGIKQMSLTWVYAWIYDLC